MEKIDQILESLYDRVIEPIEAKTQILDLFVVSNPLSCDGCKYNNTTNDELCITCGDEYKNKAT